MRSSFIVQLCIDQEYPQLLTITVFLEEHRLNHHLQKGTREKRGLCLPSDGATLQLPSALVNELGPLLKSGFGLAGVKTEQP